MHGLALTLYSDALTMQTMVSGGTLSLSSWRLKLEIELELLEIELELLEIELFR